MIASGFCRVPTGQSQQTPFSTRDGYGRSGPDRSPTADPNDIVVRRCKIGPLKVTLNPVSAFFKKILWGQKTEQAREEMPRGEQEAKSEIPEHIEKMKADKRRNDDLIVQEKADFGKTVLLEIMSH